MALVWKNPYKGPYVAAKNELEQISQERAELVQRLSWIDQRVIYLQGTIQALAPLAEDEGQPPPGLAELCYEVISATGREVAPAEVRLLIASKGIHLNYTNPMAVLHTTLRRMKEAGYLVDSRSDGKLRYSIAGGPPLMASGYERT